MISQYPDPEELDEHKRRADAGWFRRTPRPFTPTARKVEALTTAMRRMHPGWTFTGETK